jgi:hypothetical protein
VASGDPIQQGLIASLDIEKLKDQFPPIKDGIPGQAGIGVTVRSPILRDWTLEIAEGESPDPSDYQAIPIPSSVDNTAEIETTAVGSPIVLNGDNLDNATVYTVRLTATVNAQTANGNPIKAIAYEKAVPVRAKIISPPSGMTFVGRWGWPLVTGYIDSRDLPNLTSRYGMKAMDQTGQVQVSLTPQAPQYLGSSSYYQTLIIHSPPYDNQIFRQTMPQPLSVLQEQNHTLQVIGYVIGEEFIYRQTEDSISFRVDNTDFGSSPGWPVKLPSIAGGTHGAQNPVGQRHGVRIQAIDAAGNDYRIFVQIHGHMIALLPNGQVLWDRPVMILQDRSDEFLHDGPSFLVEDIDGDGRSEVVFTGVEWNETAGQLDMIVDAVDPDTGISINGNWPYRLPYERFGQIGKIHSGNFVNDPVLPNARELIFFARGQFSKNWLGQMHLVDINATLVTATSAPIDLYAAAINMDVIDYNGDGIDEVYLNPSSIMDKDGNELLPIELLHYSSLRGSSQVSNRLDGDPLPEYLVYTLSNIGSQLTFNATVYDDNGLVMAGNWPRVLEQATNLAPSYIVPKYSEIFARLADLNGDGLDEIILAYEKIRVINADGTDSSFPQINLNGESLGLKLYDIDNDGVLEYLVLVRKYFEGDEFQHLKSETKLHAYELNGIEITTQNRWPISVSSTFGVGVDIADIGANGSHELIHVIGWTPDSIYPMRTIHAGVIESLQLN